MLDIQRNYKKAQLRKFVHIKSALRCQAVLYSGFCNAVLLYLSDRSNSLARFSKAMRAHSGSSDSIFLARATSLSLFDFENDAKSEKTRVTNFLYFLLVFHRSLAWGALIITDECEWNLELLLIIKKNWGEFLVVRRRVAAQRERTPPARERE